MNIEMKMSKDRRIKNLEISLRKSEAENKQLREYIQEQITGALFRIAETLGEIVKERT